MTTVHTGCAGFVKPRERYIDRLDYVEFDLRAPAPTPKALAAWKKQRPENFTYGLVAPNTLYGDPSWPLRDPAKVRSELDRLANNVDALGARVVVFRTPMAVSPGSVALTRLQPVFERAVKFAPIVVWEPAGLWERPAAVEWASQFGVIVASDPLHDELDEPVVYARMRGLGVDQRYHVGRLEEIAEALAGADEAFVVFASNAAWREALGFKALAAGLEADELLDDEDAAEADDEEEDADDEDGDFEDGDDEEDEG